MTDALQATAAPMLTVYLGTSDVDRSVASERALRLLSDAGDRLAESQLTARAAGQATGATRLAVAGEVVTISAHFIGRGVTRERHAAIRIGGDRRQPYRVLAWQWYNSSLRLPFFLRSLAGRPLAPTLPPELVAVWKAVFYSTLLSVDGNVSRASRHDVRVGISGALSRSLGVAAFAAPRTVAGRMVELRQARLLMWVTGKSCSPDSGAAGGARNGGAPAALALPGLCHEPKK